LISDRSDDPFIERIRAELVAIGFTTVARKNDMPLEKAAREINAVAAIRVLPTRQGVEVWMADRTSGRSLLRQVIVDENPAGPNQSVIALQTAELLRTSLFENPATTQSSAHAREPAPPSGATPTAPAAPTSSAAPSTATPSTPSPSTPSTPLTHDARTTGATELNPPPSAGLQAAVGPLYSPGGAGASLQIWVSLQRSLSHHAALALDLSAPLRAAALSGPEGTAHIGTYMAGVAFLLQTRTAADRIFINGGVALAALRVSFDSDANAPLLAHSTGVTAGAAYVRSDIGVELASWLRLGVRASAGAALSRVDVRFAGNDAGSWGRPFAGAFFLAEVPWR
jgi:hypothetical protein